MMFYRPILAETGKMWDTWIYWHEGAYYLYYLAKSGKQWDNISMATSSDGVNWSEIGPILKMNEGVTWMGTGAVWESLDSSVPGRFILNFSEWRGERQTIFFARSDDLIHWTRLVDSFQFTQDDRWYHPLGRWDCIWAMPHEEYGYLGYWTATPLPETGGRFGYGKSSDGLTWEALPPPQVPGGNDGEVGAVEQINGKTYMMFGHYPHMQVLVAEEPEGPFYAATKNRMLLSEGTYFSRFLHFPDGLGVNHHLITPEGKIFMGLLKWVDVDGEGVLRLKWWRGNDRLKDKYSLFTYQPDILETDANLIHLQAVDAANGSIIECSLILPEDQFQARRGVYIECADSSGTVILFDSQGRAEISHSDRQGKQAKFHKLIDREFTFNEAVNLRLCVQHELVEIYLDDVLIDCFSMASPASGNIGLIRGDDSRSIQNVCIWR